MLNRFPSSRPSRSYTADLQRRDPQTRRAPESPGKSRVRLPGHGDDRRAQSASAAALLIDPWQGRHPAVSALQSRSIPRHLYRMLSSRCGRTWAARSGRPFARVWRIPPRPVRSLHREQRTSAPAHLHRIISAAMGIERPRIKSTARVSATRIATICAASSTSSGTPASTVPNRRLSARRRPRRSGRSKS